MSGPRIPSSSRFSAPFRPAGGPPPESNYLGSMLLRRDLYNGLYGNRYGGAGGADQTVPANQTGNVLLGEPPVGASFKDRLLAGLTDVAQEPQHLTWQGPEAPPAAGSFLEGALSAFGTVRGGMQNRAVATAKLNRQSLADQLQQSISESTIQRNQSEADKNEATVAGLQSRDAQTRSDANFYRGLYPELSGLSDDEAVRQGRAIKASKLIQQRTSATSVTPQQRLTDQTTSATGDAEGLTSRFPNQVVGSQVDEGSSAQFIHDYLAKKYPGLPDGNLWGIASKVIAEHKKGRNAFSDLAQPAPVTQPAAAQDTTTSGPDAGDN